MDARQWHRRAFRNVNMARVVELWNVRDWPSTQTDGSEFFPQIEEISGALDPGLAHHFLAQDRFRCRTPGHFPACLESRRGEDAAVRQGAPGARSQAGQARRGKAERGGDAALHREGWTRSAAREETEFDLWTPAGRIVVSGGGTTFTKNATCCSWSIWAETISIANRWGHLLALAPGVDRGGSGRRRSL